MADRPKECSPLAAKGSSTAVKVGTEDSVPVTFVLSSKGRTSGDVVILGSWDDWSQAKKLNNKEDTLEACLDLPSGDYEYKFMMGKTWFCDTTKPVVPNVFGTLNNYIEVVKETDGGSATSFPETVQVTHLDPETLQKALAKVSEEKQTSEGEVEKTDERSIAGGDDKNSTTFVEEQTNQESKVSEEKETYEDEVEKTDESNIVEGDENISATCVEEQTIQDNKVLEEKQTCEDEVDESNIVGGDDKTSSRCVQEQTIQEDTESTDTVAPQQFIMQDSLMSICMTPDMPPPVTSKQTTHEDKDFSEETVSLGRKTDEPTVCICRKPVPIPVRPIPQETTSKDVIESKSVATTETTSQDKTVPEDAEVNNEKSEETAQQHEEVVKEAQPELTMETKVIKVEQTAVSMVERLEEKDDIKTTAQETTQMVETLTPDVEKESKERFTPDSVEKEDNTVPVAIMIKDITGKEAALVEKEVKPDERAEDKETVSREGKTDEPVIAICYKPTPITLVLPPETTSEDNIDSKSVATTDITSQDKTVGDVAEGTDKKSDETAQQQKVKVVEEQPESSMDEEVGKPVEQAADDTVQKVECVEVSMETPLRDEEVEVIDEKSEEVVQDIKEKPDQKVSNEETPQNEATERPDLDVSDKSEEKTPSQTTHPDQAADEDVIDIVVQSIDEDVVKASPVADKTFEENIPTEVTTPDETIQTTLPCTVATPEGINETEVSPQEKAIREVSTNLETVATTESPIQDKEETETDIVTATEEPASSEIQQPDETSRKTVADTVHEVSPDIAEKADSKKTTAKVETSHDTVLVVSEDVSEKGPSKLPPAKQLVEVVVLDSAEKLDDTTQTETPQELSTRVADTAEKVTSKTAPTFEPTQKDAPNIAEEVKVITVKITKEPQTGKPFKAAALQSKTYAQAVRESMPEVEKTVQENVDMSEVGETHKETPPKDKSVDETVPENVELPKEEVTEMLPSETVEETVSEKEELTKEEIHMDAPSEDKIIKTIAEPQSVEFVEEKVHEETPPQDKPVERVVSEKTEEPKKEIHTETPPEDKTPKNTVQQQKVEVVEEEKEEVQVVVQEKVQTETLSPDKTVETTVSEKSEGLEEEVSIETPPEDKRVEETVQPQQVSEVLEETIHTEAPSPDKPVVKKVSEKVEEPKEEIHTEAPSEDKTTEKTVQPQNVEVTEENVHTETPLPDKPVVRVVSEKTEEPKMEIHTETPPEDKTPENTVLLQQVEVVEEEKEEVQIVVQEKAQTETLSPGKAVETKVSEKTEGLEEEVSIETPPEDKTVENTVQQQQVEVVEEEKEEVQVIVSKKVEMTEEEIHTETPPEDKTVEKTVQSQEGEASEEKVHTETPPPYKPVEISDTVEITKEEVHIEASTENNKPVEKIVQPQQVSEVSEKQVHTETPPPEKTVEIKVSKKTEVVEEEIHTEAPSEGKTVDETVQPQQVEVVDKNVYAETPSPDKPVERIVLKKMEVAEEEIHTETPLEDKTVEDTVQQQKVEVVVDKVQPETPPSDKTVETIVSEKTKTPEEEIHTATPPEDKTVEKTIQHITVEVSKEESHTETPPTDKPVEKNVLEKVEVPKEKLHTEAKSTVDKTAPHIVECYKTIHEILTEAEPTDETVEIKLSDKAEVPTEKLHTDAEQTVEKTAPPKAESCYKTIHEILMEDTTEKIPLFEYTQFTLMPGGETSGDVFVQGSWDGWTESFKLNKSEDGSYSESVMLPYGLHEYKYRVGNSWIHDDTKAAVRNAFGTINNVLRVPAEAGGKDSLELPQEEDSDLEECMRVRLDWTGEASEDVFVSGSWDGWTRSWKLKKRNGDEYSVSLTLPCRQHQYKLRAGNTWFYDKTKPTVPNSFGTFNNAIEVAAAPEKIAKPWGKRKLTEY